MQVANVYASNVYFFILSVDGLLYGVGYNSSYELGLGHSEPVYVPTLISKLSDKKIVNVVTGYKHNFAMAETGEWYCWGSNRYGQLGLGEYVGSAISAPTPVTFFKDKKIKIFAGAYHSMALTEEGLLYSWGYNNFGQLGFQTKTPFISLPREISFFRDYTVVNIFTTSDHCIALVKF